MKCQGCIVSIKLLIIRLKTCLQGVASYQSAPRASRGEILIFSIDLVILIHLHCKASLLMCLMNRMLKTSPPSTLMYSQLQRWLAGFKLENQRWERSIFSSQYDWISFKMCILSQVVHGQVVLRKERPAIFCLVSSIFCCMLAVIGMQVSDHCQLCMFSDPGSYIQTSTAGLLHIAVFLALTLPALLVTTIPNTFEHFVPNCLL